MNPLAFDFMRTAYEAAAAVALVSGATGYFLVLRGQSFAGHALGHVGFAGAAAALLAGLPALAGLVAVTTLGGMLMGAFGDKLAERDVGIGMVLALSLGIGILCLGYFSGSAAQATSLLFGNVFGVDQPTVLVLLGAGAVCLAALAAISRPLLFASLQPALAEAAGVRLRLVGMLFLGVVGLAVAAAAQVVGVLLVFSLLVGPAAAAQRFTARVGAGFWLAVSLAMGEALGGVTLAFYTDWPASFCITLLAATGYGTALLADGGRKQFFFEKKNQKTFAL
jgi:zinc/manganese transport system permease protein